jgi:hypothetical protein
MKRPSKIILEGVIEQHEPRAFFDFNWLVNESALMLVLSFRISSSSAQPRLGLGHSFCRRSHPIVHGGWQRQRAIEFELCI